MNAVTCLFCLNEHSTQISILVDQVPSEMISLKLWRTRRTSICQSKMNTVTPAAFQISMFREYLSVYMSLRLYLSKTMLIITPLMRVSYSKQHEMIIWHPSYILLTSINFSDRTCCHGNHTNYVILLIFLKKIVVCHILQTITDIISSCGRA